MIRALSKFFTAVMQRWLPDAYVFAIALTLIIFVCGITIENKTFTEMTNFWGNGIWNLLTFSMQMVVILVTGHILASSGPVTRILTSLATLATSPGKAVILTTLISGIAMWINWGFGLVVGALIAREIAARSKQFHYPLLVASAYSGFLLWHIGLSGSIPLKIASPANDKLGQLLNGEAIPLSMTVFSPSVLLIALALLVTLPFLNKMMLPAPGDTIKPYHPPTSTKQDTPNNHTLSPAEKLEHNILPSAIIAGISGFYLVNHFMNQGGITLNIISLVFLCLGIIFHRTPANYLSALNDAIQHIGGIVLQFPLYAGMMSMMVGSGLAVSLSEWFIAISTPDTFLIFTFLSAGIVNFFVPSGGGQWALQAPVVLPAAAGLDISTSSTAIAVALGDAWTNMVQPFWALPLLAISGLKIKDIMGYCTMALIWSGLLICSLLIILF